MDKKGLSRVRVQTFAPLPIIKAWLEIPPAIKTIEQLVSQLHLPATCKIQAEISGFTLLFSSSVDILHENDVIEIKAAEDSTDVLIGQPINPLPNQSISTSNFKKNSTEIKSTSANLANPSTSDSDSDSDSDSSSSSSPSLSSSSSSDDSSDESSHEPPEEISSKVSSKVIKSNARNKSELPISVPPGQGKPQTRKRNQRRKLLNQYRAQEREVKQETVDVQPEQTQVDIQPTEPTPLIDESVSIAEATGFTTVVPDIPMPRVYTQPPTAPAATPTKPPTKRRKKNTIPIPPWTPSVRSDVPPNIIVSRVDVEDHRWIPGQAEIVEGTSEEWEWERKDELEQLQKVWPGVSPTVTTTRATEAAVHNPSGEWPLIGDIQKNWETYAVLDLNQSVPVSKKVAVQIFELDPKTFTPKLEIKFGRLLGFESGNVRIQLHSSCLPKCEEEEEAEEMEGKEFSEEDFEESTGYRRKHGLRFGGDMLDTTTDGVWEGTAEVKLL